MTFEIDRSNNGQYYFRIIASNSKTLAHSETYVAKADARHAIDLIKRDAASATIVDLTLIHADVGPVHFGMVSTPRTTQALTLDR